MNQPIEQRPDSGTVKPADLSKAGTPGGTKSIPGKPDHQAIPKDTQQKDSPSTPRK